MPDTVEDMQRQSSSGGFCMQDFFEQDYRESFCIYIKNRMIESKY
jgi:hypothetical protein